MRSDEVDESTGGEIKAQVEQNQLLLSDEKTPITEIKKNNACQRLYPVLSTDSLTGLNSNSWKADSQCFTTENSNKKEIIEHNHKPDEIPEDFHSDYQAAQINPLSFKEQTDQRANTIFHQQHISSSLKIQDQLLTSPTQGLKRQDQTPASSGVYPSLLHSPPFHSNLPHSRQEPPLRPQLPNPFSSLPPPHFQPNMPVPYSRPPLGFQPHLPVPHSRPPPPFQPNPPVQYLTLSPEFQKQLPSPHARPPPLFPLPVQNSIVTSKQDGKIPVTYSHQRWVHPGGMQTSINIEDEKSHVNRPAVQSKISENSRLHKSETGFDSSSEFPQQTQKHTKKPDVNATDHKISLVSKGVEIGIETMNNIAAPMKSILTTKKLPEDGQNTTQQRLPTVLQEQFKQLNHIREKALVYIKRSYENRESKDNSHNYTENVAHIETKKINDDTSSDDNVIGYDVMLSYQWDHQEVVKNMKKFLTKKGLNIWMDIDHIDANINKSMAEGVNHSRMVVLCLSEKYEKSHNCKKEYNFVDKKHKPFVPVFMERFSINEGDLDIIIGQEKYYTLYDQQFEQVMEQIYNAILKKLDEDTRK